MDSTTQTADGDIKLNSDLFNLAEKLRIQLQKKDQELADKNEQIKELSANLDLSMSQANKELSAHLDLAISRADQADELKNGLANAQQTIDVLQMSLWKSFPFPDLPYYVKTQSGSQNGQFRYLKAEVDTYYLRSSVTQTRTEFKFTKNSDGTFSIYSMGYYLQTDTYSSRVGFTANYFNAEKFVLFFHQNQQAGISIDFSTLAGYFLCMDYNNNYVTANSRTAPADKFLVLPVGVQ